MPPEHKGTRLDQFPVSQLPDVSRVRIQQLIEQKKILINGKTPKPSMKLRGGEEIAITGEVELPPLKAFAEDIPLDVIFEDADFAVINKAAGMVVHASNGSSEDPRNRGTLVNALLHHCGGSLSGIGGVARPGIVHRIDKDTSGLLIVAKTDVAHEGLAKQFAAHSIDRRYLAIVNGILKAGEGTVDAALARVEAGTYGICEVCGEPVPDGRLEARPTARTCVEHAR